MQIIKNGAIIDRITLHNEQATKSFLAIGRFDPCEIKVIFSKINKKFYILFLQLEHPSVSRFHAILQYGECIRGKPQWLGNSEVLISLFTLQVYLRLE